MTQAGVAEIEDFFLVGQSFTVEARRADGTSASAEEAAGRNSVAWLGWIARAARTATMGSVLGIAMGFPVWAAPPIGPAPVRTQVDLGVDSAGVQGVVASMFAAGSSTGSELRISNAPLDGVGNSMPKALTWIREESGASVCEVSLTGMDRLTTWLLQQSKVLSQRGDAARKDIKAMALMHELAHCEMGQMATADSGRNIRQDFMTRVEPILGHIELVSRPKSGAPALAIDEKQVLKGVVAMHGLEMEADIRALLHAAWSSLSGARSQRQVEEGVRMFNDMVEALHELRHHDHAGPNDVNFYLTEPAIEAISAYVVQEYAHGRGDQLERSLTSPAVAGRSAISLTLGAMPTTLPAVLAQTGPAMSVALGREIQVQLLDGVDYVDIQGYATFQKMLTATTARPVEPSQRMAVH